MYELEKKVQSIFLLSILARVIFFTGCADNYVFFFVEGKKTTKPKVVQKALQPSDVPEKATGMFI